MKLNLFFKAGAFWAGVIAVAGWSGCSTSTSAGACTTNADCVSGEYCDTATGACTAVAACASDADCASGDTCDTASGVCVAVAGCMSDADCAPDETCDTSTGVCAFAGCLSDADCLPGEICDTATGTCMGTPTTEPSCQQCACMDVLSMGGCANVCDDAQNGNPGTPNFCNGVAALPQCAKCLQDNCGGISSPPDPTNPSTCM